MTIIWSKVPCWEVSITWNKRNAGWLRIQWGNFVIKYWNSLTELPHNTGRKCKGEVIPFLLWMVYSLCSPTELVTLHSYSFGANDAMQDFQCRLCPKGFKQTMLQVRRMPFSATEIIKHSTRTKPRSAAIQSMNNFSDFTLTTLSRGSKMTQAR